MLKVKQFVFLLFCLTVYSNLHSQALPDSIKRAFHEAKSDVDKGRILITYFDMNTDKDTILTNQVALKKYFEKKHDQVMVDYVDMAICRQLSRGSEYAEAISELFQLLPRFEKRKDEYGTMVCNRHFSYAYYAAGDSSKTLQYDRKTVELSVSLGGKNDIAIAYNNIAADMAEYGHFDSAFLYAGKAVAIAQEINDSILIAKTLGTMGEGYIARKLYDSALHYVRRSLPIARVHSQLDYVYVLNDFAQIFLARHQTDSAIHNATRAVGVARKINMMNQALRAYQYLAIAYKEKGLLDSAYKYLELTVNTKNLMYGADKVKQVQLVDVREQNRQREIQQQKLDLKNDIKIYGLLAGLMLFTFIGVMLYRNNHKEKKAKVLLQLKNDTIEQTLSELRSTQHQLIQSEKMASLGELTAGIAHEIQNPLNFVNNFSDVNTELIDELKQELAAGNVKVAVELADTIKDNEQKINHHGKRADAIVKGMLQHSRAGSGQKELVDINALADEYLRLAYHGLRAKDKSFNATLKTGYDESVGNVKVVPQDIGRVILNLITNAFYAVNERSTLRQAQGDNTYEPTVTITTKRNEKHVLISVKDNGKGIPQKVLNKIFQPFFTTKPTGQGTGLGLSLAYDIVKAHEGELVVTTEEGIGTEFTITLKAQG